MPIITQKFIFRSDLQANTSVLYLFGDNLVRTGYGGQAKEMRDEPNAVGIATKRAPGRRDQDYFSDDTIEANKDLLDADFMPAYVHVAMRGLLVIPADGLGTGLSELPTRAPLTNQYLEAWIDRLYNPMPNDAMEHFEEFINSLTFRSKDNPHKHAMEAVAVASIIPGLRKGTA